MADRNNPIGLSPNRVTVDPSLSTQQWIETRPGVFQTRHPRTGQPTGGEFIKQPDGRLVPGSLPAKLGALIDQGIEGGVNMAEGASEGFFGGQMPTDPAGQFGYQVGNFASNNPASMIAKGVIIGPKAAGKMWDHAAAILARRDLLNKTAGGQVFNESGGYFMGPEGLMRRMIPDHVAQESVTKRLTNDMRTSASTGTPIIATLGDIFKEAEAQGHELFKAYPEFKRYRVMYNPKLPENMAGSFNPFTKVIEINPNTPPDKAFKTLLHEVQHGIQISENWQAGGNVDMVLSDTTKTVESRLRSAAKTIKERYTPMQGKYSVDQMMAVSQELQAQKWGAPVSDEQRKIAEYAIKGGILKDSEARSLIRDLAHYGKLHQKVAKDRKEGYSMYRLLQGESEAREVERQIDLGMQSFPGQMYDQFPFDKLNKRGAVLPTGAKVQSMENPFYENNITNNPILGR
jgi:hypothetical protein